MKPSTMAPDPQNVRDLRLMYDTANRVDGTIECKNLMKGVMSSRDFRLDEDGGVEPGFTRNDKRESVYDGDIWTLQKLKEHGIDKSYAGSLRFDALSVNHGVFDELMGTERPMRVTLGYRQRGSRTVRHRHIWEYRRERKYGKRRGRVWFTRLVVIPDVMVTSAGREFAVGVDSPVEVEFSVGGQGWSQSSSKACS